MRAFLYLSDPGLQCRTSLLTLPEMTPNEANMILASLKEVREEMKKAAFLPMPQDPGQGMQGMDPQQAMMMQQQMMQQGQGGPPGMPPGQDPNQMAQMQQGGPPMDPQMMQAMMAQQGGQPQPGQDPSQGQGGPDVMGMLDQLGQGFEQLMQAVQELSQNQQQIQKNMEEMAQTVEEVAKAISQSSGFEGMPQPGIPMDPTQQGMQEGSMPGPGGMVPEGMPAM